MLAGMSMTETYALSLAISWEQIAEGTSDGKPCFSARLWGWTGIWSRGELLLDSLAENSPGWYGVVTWLNSLFNILVLGIWQLDQLDGRRSS